MKNWKLLEDHKDPKHYKKDEFCNWKTPSIQQTNSIKTKFKYTKDQTQQLTDINNYSYKNDLHYHQRIFDLFKGSS
jgi:hypothetical protein